MYKSIFLIFLFASCAYANTNLTEHFAQPLSSKISFKDRRDYQITKQDLDYSCGASSLSTILTYFYDKPTTEAHILDDMNLDKTMSSFLDLAKVSEQYGFVGRGMLMDYDNLSKIKIPVIVYLNLKRNDHFSVVRAIDDKRVYLADSSMGNRILTRQQFETMWLTENKKSGKVLFILPKDTQNTPTNHRFIAIERTNEFLRQAPKLLREFL